MSGAAAGREPFVQRTAIWIPVVVITLLVLPMVVTRRSFGSDWTLHLWLMRQQQWNIEAMGHPGLFVSVQRLGAFYPIFSFVGSGIYSVGGYLSILLGDRPVLAYKLLYASGLCLSYGGMTWLSVQRGLRRWRSQVAGLVFVTGSYTVSDMAVRGDLGAFMGVAAIPFLLAATYAVLTSPARRLRHLLAVVVGVFVFTGSHNITLLWGTIFIGMLGVLALVTYGPQLRPPLQWGRVGALLGCAAIGVGLNAWYLLPDLFFSLDTQVATVSHGRLPVTYFRASMLDPLSRSHDRPFPWPAFVWAVLVAGSLWRGKGVASKKLFVGIVAIIGANLVLILAERPWRWLPHLLYNLQFARRLGAYVMIGTALLVVLALEWHVSARGTVKRVATVALAGILVLSVGVATSEMWRVRSVYVKDSKDVPVADGFADVVIAARYVIPPSWRDLESFRDVSSRRVFHKPRRILMVPLAEVSGSSFSGTLDVPDGPGRFNTNISAGPRFVRMTGIRAVGRTPRGFVVAVRDPRAPPTGPIAVTIAQANTNIMRWGSTVSLLSAVALLVMLAWPLRRFFSSRIPPGRSGERAALSA